MPRPGYSPEKNRENCRRYRQKHRERLLASQRERHAANREANNAQRKERYGLEDPEQRAAMKRLRGELRRQAYPWERLLRAASDRARAKGLPFTLTEEWATTRWTGRCEISGISFVVKNTGEPGPKFFSPSIDQIEAKAGYTPENCRFVLWAVNALKHDGSDEDMILVAKSISDKFSS